MKFKKLLSCVLALSMISATVVTNVIAAETENTSYVLYENDFESYTGGAFATTVSAGTQGWTGITNVAKLAATKVGDNTWIDPTGASNWTFDMGSPRMSTGKLYISYDVIVDGQDENSASHVRFTYTNSSGSTVTKYLFYINTKNLEFQYAAGLNSSGTKTKIVNYTPGKSHRVDILWDINGKEATVVIDGDTTAEIASSSACPVETIIFSNQPGVKFDNLKIAKMTDDSFTAKMGEVGYDTFDIKFSESVKAVAKSNIAVTDEDGNTVAVKDVTVDNFGKAVVTLEDDLESEADYNVTLSGIKNVFGTALSTSNLSFTTPVIPERETILELDTPAQFTAANLTGFASYTGADAEGAKWTYQPELTDTIDNLYIPFGKPAYAVGDIIFEYRASMDTNTTVFKPYLNYIEDGLHSAAPYISGDKYAYQNIKTDRSGTYKQLKDTDLRDGWHTHKIVYHVEEQNADIYLDDTHLGTYEYNNFDGFVRYGSYVQLRLDWNIAENLENSPHILFDYIKVTQEYYPNETGFYILQQEIVDGTDTTTSKPTKTVKTYALNLTGAPISGYFLGGVYNGDRLSDAAIVSDTAQNGEVLGGSKKFTIDDTTNLQVKGFLWDTDFSPLCDPIVE